MGGEALGFPGEALGLFIELEVVGNVVSPATEVEMLRR
jgi:hypothetical protein